MEISEKDLSIKNFQTVLKEMGHRISLSKMRKFSLALEECDYVLDETDMAGNRCIACGIRASHDGERCSVCEGQRMLGQRLVSAKTFSLGSESSGFRLLDSVYLTFDQEFPAKSEYVRFSLSGESADLPLWRLNLYTPPQEDFSQIAGQALEKTEDGKFAGKPFLSYVKIDVDNLGEIFIHGFPKETYSLSRYVSLSRLLHHFFNVHVYTLLKKEYPHAYTVLSGGDDVFLVVPWTQALPLVSQIEGDFKEFCCNSEFFHFSTGIVLGRESTPFGPLNEKANHALDVEAKEEGGRNCLVLFGTRFTYDQVTELTEDIQMMRNFVKDSRYPVSSSFLYRMYRYVGDRLTGSDARKYSSVGKMRYDIARNFTGDEKPLEFRSEAAGFFIKRFDFGDDGQLERFRVALICTLYSIRETEEEEIDHVGIE